jgi:Ca2+-binding EF-hand superfamily protein
MRDAFQLFDTDGDGSVTAEELKHVMDTLFQTNLSEQELNEVRGLWGTMTR